MEPVATALAGSIAVAVVLGIGRFVYTPILPPMVEALGLNKSIAGLIPSGNFFGYLVGALIVAMPILLGSQRLRLLGAIAIGALTTTGMRRRFSGQQRGQSAQAGWINR